MAAAVTGGTSVLIMDRDRATRDAIKSLCEVLEIGSNVTLTQSNAVKAYRDNAIKVVFLDAEMLQVNARVLAEEFERMAADRHQKRPPLVFLYENREILARTGLTELPHSRPLRKPVALTAIYEILSAVGLTTIRPADGSYEINTAIADYRAFGAQTDAMLSSMQEDFLEP